MNAVTATVVMAWVFVVVMMIGAPALSVVVRRSALVVVAGAAEGRGILPVHRAPMGQQAALPAASWEQKVSVLQQTAVETTVEQK